MPPATKMLLHVFLLIAVNIAYLIVSKSVCVCYSIMYYVYSVDRIQGRKQRPIFLFPWHVINYTVQQFIYIHSTTTITKSSDKYV